MANDQQQLVTWLAKVGLSRHAELLMDDNGEFGFRCLNDLQELSEQEVGKVAEAAHMNIGERKRFHREVKGLQQQASGKEDQASGGTDNGAGAKQAAEARDAGAPQPSQAEQEELEALREELRRQREELEEQKRQQEQLEEQRRKEVEELERKREAEQMQQRRQQELLEEQQELLERKRQEQEELQKELERRRQQEQLQAEEYEEVPQPPVRLTEWFLVVKSMVFIKATPHKDSESLAFVKRGEWLQVHGRRQLDDETNQWAELTSWELQRRGRVGPPQRGFALIDGSALGLGRLLEGPFEEEQAAKEQGRGPRPSEARLARSVVASADDDDDEDEEEAGAGRRKAPRPQLTREQIVAANWAEEELRLLEAWGPESCPRAEQLPRGVKVLQAVYNFVYVKRSADPSVGAITKLSCRPNACFFSTGAVHFGPQGGEWAEQYSPEGEPSWLLVDGPGFQADGPMLLDEGAAAEHIPVAVHYCAPRRSVCLFRTLINRNATAQKLCTRFCSVTGLNPKCTMLTPKASQFPGAAEDLRMAGDAVMSSQPLLPHMTLLSYGIRAESDIYLAYAGSFEEDYRSGMLLQESE